MKEISSSNSISNEIEKDSNDEVRELVDSFNSYIRKLKQVIALDAIVIEEVDEVILKVNNGFYVQKVEKNSDNPKIQELKNSINSSNGLIGVAVSEFLSKIVLSGKKLNDDTNILSTSAERLFSSTNEQAASLEETAAAPVEVKSIVKSNIQKVQQMSSLANYL